MGLFDLFKGQFVDVIRWENPENYLLIKKFDRSLDEIKDDATLIVEPGYAVIFVHNGKIEAIETEPGRWSLSTENKPFITSIKNVLRGFQSPDKSAIYFIKTIEILNQKWGTKNPVKYIDPVYNFPVKLRAFGNFSFKIVDIPKFWINYVGTKSEVSIDEVRNIIVDRILQQITDIFAEAKYSYNEIDANRVELANKIKESLNNSLGDLGLQITDFRIEDINFTEDTEELIRKIADQIANVNAVNQMKNIDKRSLNNYTELKKADALEKAAENEGMGGAMMGMLVGGELGSRVISNSNNVNEDIESKLLKLKSLLDKGLITKEEYEQKKKEILENF